MTQFLEWLLGLENVRLDEGTSSLELFDPAARWVMLFGAIFVLLFVSMNYRRERVKASWRRTLIAIRVCALMLVLGLISDPGIRLTREKRDQSVVAILVDDSASMAESDAPSHSGSTNTTATADAFAPADSRYQQVVAALTAGDSALITRLAQNQRVELWRFSDTAMRVSTHASSADAASLAAATPQGTQTDLTGALQQVARQTARSRLAAVVIISDGRQTLNAIGETVPREFADRGVSVHTVSVGSPVPRLDLELSTVAVDEDVFLKDIAGVAVRVNAVGLADDLPTHVQLINADDGTVLDEHDMTLTTHADAITSDTSQADVASPALHRMAEAELRFRAASTGRVNLRVAVAPLDGERNTENNSIDLTIRVHDEKLRVLYVDGPPRFEYRFLKNTLMREPTIASSCLLLDATASFPQEGTEPIREFPTTPAELARYDVVLLGDVDPRGDWISPSQMEMLVEFVSARGGGVGFIAGERSMPNHLLGTPLQKLLPVRVESAATSGSVGGGNYHFELTAAGSRHPLMRFEVDPAENNATIQSLRPWFWYASVAGPKPGADVIARHPTALCEDGPLPLIVAGRFGAGNTLYVGSDDVWRWRYYRGEAFYDTFWVNALRMLAGDRRWGLNRQWRLTTDRRIYDDVSAVSIRLTRRAADEFAIPDSVPIRIRDAQGGTVANLRLERSPAEPEVFAGEYWPQRNGNYTVLAFPPDALTPEDAPSRTFQVDVQSPELRKLEADPTTLRAIADTGGGRNVTLGEVDTLLPLIPDRSLVTVSESVESIWDTHLALLLLVMLLAAEWTIRKLRGMA